MRTQRRQGQGQLRRRVGTMRRIRLWRRRSGCRWRARLSLPSLLAAAVRTTMMRATPIHVDAEAAVVALQVPLIGEGGAGEVKQPAQQQHRSGW